LIEEVKNKQLNMINNEKKRLDLLREQRAEIVKQLEGGEKAIFPINTGKPRGLAAGGRLGVDNLLARVSPNEMIMNARASNTWRPVLTAMNAGMYSNGGSTTTVGDININMTQSGSAQTDVRELANLLRRELKRGTIRLG